MATADFQTGPVLRVVAAVIERDGKILIGQRRAGGRHALKWEFPGGKVEVGETPEEATVRELEEEPAIYARVDGEIMRYEFEYPGREPILLVFFRVVEFDGEPRNLEYAEMRWESIGRLAEYDFLEGDAGFI